MASWPGSSRPFCYVLLLRRNRLLNRRRFLGLIGLAIGLAQELVEELGALLLILRFLCFLRLPLFGEPVIVHFPAHRILHPWWRDRCQRGNACPINQTTAMQPGRRRVCLDWKSKSCTAARRAPTSRRSRLIFKRCRPSRRSGGFSGPPIRWHFGRMPCSLRGCPGSAQPALS